MLIVAATPLYPPSSRVGAWLATHDFLAALVMCGHDVRVVPYMAGHHPYELDGVKVLRRGTPFPDADVYISHSGDIGELHHYAKRVGTPSVRMVHGRSPDKALDGAALVVFNSQANATAHSWGGRHVVCLPPTHSDRFRTTSGDRFTLVNLSKEKGGLVFARLAEAMPDHRFLGVKGGYGRQAVRPAPNLEVIPNTPNMRGDVYARTRVLLMPSERETWGMVAVEAMASGIPVVAHPADGLIESLGPAGLFADRDDLAAWRGHLDRLSDPDEWATASAAALARSADLDPQPSLDRFVEAVEALA